MIKYKVWKCDKDDDYLLIEVFNVLDIPDVQKEFIEKGYMILQTERDVFGYHLIKIQKMKFHRSEE